MCCNPVHILNPKLDFSLRDKLTLDVPCGKCSECQQEKQRQWFVRSYYQWLHCIHHRGIGLYITLTFDNEHVPTFEMSNGKVVRCFSKRVIQLFLKRLRKLLNRHFKGFELKYFICSELGDKRFRPHHHGVLYLYPPKDYFVKYKGLRVNHIKSLVRIAWQQGFVSFGRKLDNIRVQGVIENENALFYVCKYVSKDIDWDYNHFKDIPQENRPFHLQSKGFGSAMIDYLGLKKFDVAFNFFVKGQFYIQGFDKPYCIPQYITRKCLYDYVYKRNSDGTTDVKYNLNELGMKVRKQVEFDSIEEKASKFKAVLSCCSSFVTDSDRLLLLNGRCGTEFDCVESLQDWLDSRIINYTSLACYVSIFKDRLYVPISNYDCFSDNVDNLHYSLSDARKYLDFIYSDYIKDLRIYCEHNHIGKNGVVTDIEYNFDNLDLKSRNVYDLISQNTYAQCFPQDFEVFIEIYNTLEYFGGLDKERKYYTDLNNYRNLKLLNSSHKMEDVI